MPNLFWKKGFYFNTIFREYKLVPISELTTHYGLGPKFLYLLNLRNDCLSVSSRSCIYHSNLKQARLPLIDAVDLFQFLLNYYLLVSYPVMLQVRKLVTVNMLYYFLTGTFRGLSLKIGRPLYRRTRARTYAHFKTSVKLSLPSRARRRLRK